MTYFPPLSDEIKERLEDIIENAHNYPECGGGWSPMKAVCEAFDLGRQLGYDEGVGDRDI